MRPSSKILAFTSVAAAALAAAAPARAQSDSNGFAPVADAAAGFGGVGQLVLSLGATADEPFFFHESGGNWDLQLAPAADYFIAPHVSVGGVVSYNHASGGAGTGTNASGSDDFSLAARAGYAFAVNDRVGVWPLVGLAVNHASANHAGSTSTALTVFAPVQFIPAPHFFVGAGPGFRVALSGGGGEYGLDAVLGGWF